MSNQKTDNTNQQPETNWHATLFGCSENPTMFLLALFVPCGYSCIQCTNAKVTHPESNENAIACACSMFFGCCGLAYNRTQLRKKLSIEGGFIQDLLFSCLCCCCTVAQEWRETMYFKYKDQTRTICNYKDTNPQSKV